MAATTDLSIIGVERTELGKGPARRARRAGLVPAVMYGHGADPVHLDLPSHDVFMIVKNHTNAVLTVSYGKKKQLALVKSVQRHPVRRDIIHVDLQIVKAGEKVEVEVPIVIHGEHVSGARLQQEEFHILVSAPATSIPESIEVSVEGLEIGTVIRVADLDLPSGVEAVTDGERDVLAILELQEVAEESVEGAGSSEEGSSEA